MKNTSTSFIIFLLLMGMIHSALAQRIASTNSAPNCNCGVSPKACYQIPIIVHIIHHPNDIYPNGTNISCDQICSQINTLNGDFLKMNSDVSTVIPFFTNHVGKADISFYLHEVRRTPLPQGYSFPVYGCIPSEISPAVTGKVNKMIPLNIWVTDNNQTNFASVLATTVTGTSCDLYKACDDHGIFVDLKIFGSGEGYDLAHWASDGRGVTHEIGHWLGLRHPWGTGTQSVMEDCDCVYDTPTHTVATLCSTNEVTVPNICGDLTGPMNLQNFMGFSDEPGCRVMFTIGQVAVMQRTVTLYNNISRNCVIPVDFATFRKNGNQSSITISPNPVQNVLNLEFEQSTHNIWNFVLSDVLGKVVKRGELQNSLDLSFLQNGLYIIHFYNGKNLMSQQKVLKINSN